MVTKIKSLYGLVLTGGKSTRMKIDKASLEFHGKKQSVVCYELLDKFCEQVFISNRQEQENIEGQRNYPQIHDQAPFLDIGPLGGILSAMTTHPKVDWLVLACDLPFINDAVIENLIKSRNPKKVATAYISAHDSLPEPLCAIYEAHSFPTLKAHLNSGKSCPRKFLINAEVELLKPVDTKALDNINNPNEYQEALSTLKKHHAA